MGKLIDSLPSIPAALKLIQPYVLRADELQAKDPVMSYWCLYFAAQLGLDLKTHEPGARDYILGLITTLETMKKEIGPNDAVDHEAAGAAYVENFALKVFSLADNEDRKGEANRATAKKFLAAANFLELLKVFEKSNNAVVNDEKVRYAKWKASDIAKAFREGRKPTAGSPNKDAPFAPEVPVLPEISIQPVAGPSTSSGNSSPTAASNDSNGSGQHTPPRKLKAPTNITVPPIDAHSPGTWSTLATPGSVDGAGSSPGPNLALAGAMNRWGSTGEDSPLRSKGIDTEEIKDSLSFNSSELPLRKVHFTPSVLGGLSSTDGSPPTSPEVSNRMFTSVSSKSQPQTIPRNPQKVVPSDPVSVHLPDSSTASPTSFEGSSPPGRKMHGGQSPPSLRHSPPVVGGAHPESSPPSSGFVKPGSSPPSSGVVKPILQGEKRERRASNASRHSPPQGAGSKLPSQHGPPTIPPPPAATSSYASTSTVYSNSHGFATASKSPDKPPMAGLPPTSITSYPIYRAPAPSGPPFELTTAVIAKAQKHARFAISALEYEDAVTARSQLRAALAALGDDPSQ